MGEKNVIGKNDLLTYIQRKCGNNIASALQKFIDSLRFVSTIKELHDAQNTFTVSIVPLSGVKITPKKRHTIIDIDERRFRIYYDRNSDGNLFFVLDYRKRGKYHYFYQKIDKNIDVTLFE